MMTKRPMAPAERTLTAMLSPLAGADQGSAGALLLALRAGHDALRSAERLIVLGRALELGRARADEPGDPGRLALVDPLMSGRHAGIERTDDGYRLTDLGSKNGTFVEGQRITGPLSLRGGERIFIGGHVFVFRLLTGAQLDDVRAELGQPLGPVATCSPAFATLCRKLDRLARADTELLLVGPTGVGKEVYARAVHARSGRRGRFVALNCAAIPRELVEGELFGWRPGAHSTAQASKAGLLEEADGGTLFLDEIGEMAPDVQTKLLRFLQDKELTPLGGTQPRRLDVRVVAATNRAVAPGQGGLRDDLLGRLGAAPLALPPLADRPEDLGALVGFFLGRASARGPAPAGMDGAAARALALHCWPLNVRELEKVIATAAALCPPSALIGTAHLPDTVLHPSSSPVVEEPPSPATRKSPEPAPSVEELESLLRQHRGNVADVSRALGRQRAAVWRWIKRFGLPPDRYR